MEALGVKPRVAGFIHALPSVWWEEAAAVGRPLERESPLLEPVCCTGCQQHEPLNALQHHCHDMSISVDSSEAMYKLNENKQELLQQARFEAW